MDTQFTGTEPHPVIPLFTEAQLDQLQIDKAGYYRFRAEALEMEQADPYRNGYRSEVWELVEQQIRELRELFPVGVLEIVIMGGNRASKTRYAARKLVDVLVSKKEARAWGLQSIEAVSRSDQQPFVFQYIPREWRPEGGKLRHGRNTKIVYSRAGGFTENTFVLPNSSQCWFKFYGSNVKTLESAELDFAWADELVTPDWIEAIRFRLLNRNGLLLVTFTPVEGYSATVKEYLDGAKVLREVDAELLPIKDAHGNTVSYEKVPRILQCRNPKARVIFFHTKDNPFGNYPGMKVELANSNPERIKIRAYGVPTRAAKTQFPKFRDNIHVISLNQWEHIRKTKLTRYQFLDPCSGRNWFFIYVAIDIMNRRFIYREWPSYGHRQAYVPGIGELGEWAVPGNAMDGVRGPAQQELGWGLARYKEEFERLETQPDGTREQIFERWIDARYANTRTLREEQSVTLIEELNDIGLEFLAAPSEKRIMSDKDDGSIRLINDLLYYNDEQPLSHSNQPKLYVVETCPNTIFAFKEWTGEDGQKGACKDPIDCVREMVLSGVEYCDDNLLKPKNPWNAQFKK